jgi:hypothetical protein
MLGLQVVFCATGYNNARYPGSILCIKYRHFVPLHRKLNRKNYAYFLRKNPKNAYFLNKNQKNAYFLLRLIWNGGSARTSANTVVGVSVKDISVSLHGACFISDIF